MLPEGVKIAATFTLDSGLYVVLEDKTVWKWAATYWHNVGMLF